MDRRIATTRLAKTFVRAEVADRILMGILATLCFVAATYALL